MNILKGNDINILDLPDEILRIIVNKLDTTDIFYSLVGANQRFDRLVLDSLYIHHLDLAIKQSDIHNSSTDVDTLDKICEKILPRINEKVSKLTVDPLSVKRILGAAHYPQLHSLSLVNFQPDIFLEHLSSDIISHRLRDQITHLTVDIHSDRAKICNGYDQTIFEALSENYVAFSPWNIPYRNSLSSTLTNLKIKVYTFNDCLKLLNGCLECLSTLIIRIKKIDRPWSTTDNTEKLVKLKSFSLISDWYTYSYDKYIVPLLRRMLNLGELALQLSVLRPEAYIDGNQLCDEVLNYMPRLNKFTFNIHSHIYNSRDGFVLPSNDDIRNSFIKRGFRSIDTCADDRLMNYRGNCHVYSLPYQFHEFLLMSCCFQGGKFDKVTMLSMLDRRPFERKLLKIISEDFPFLQKLIIFNSVPQTNEQHHSSTLITFNHLFHLNLIKAHSDYAIQFLSDRNTRLSCLINLEIDYETLRAVTNDFTNEATRLNCAKIKSLKIYKPFVRPQNFESYFPFL